MTCLPVLFRSVLFFRGWSQNLAIYLQCLLIVYLYCVCVPMCAHLCACLHMYVATRALDVYTGVGLVQRKRQTKQSQEGTEVRNLAGTDPR